jgi:hypothetical protein
MMAVIGDIAVRFSADTNGLAKATKEGDNLVSSFAGSIQSSVSASLGSLALLGGGAAGIGVFMGNMATSAVSAVGDMAKGFLNLGIEAGKTLVGMVKDGLELADNLQDQAAKISTTIEEYSLLRYQLKLLGGDMEAIIPSLIKLQKNLATGSSKNTINDVLKLDNNALASLDNGVAQLKALKAGIDTLPTHGQKLAVAMELAGRGASGLLPYLLADAEQLNKLEKEAKELGAVFSAFDAERIGDANDKFDQMNFALDGLKIILAGTISPLISAAVEETLKWAKSMGDFRTITTDTLDGVAFGLDVTINAANGFIAVLGLLAAPLLGIGAACAKMISAPIELAAMLPGASDSIIELAKTSKGAANDLASLAKGSLTQGFKALGRGAEGSGLQEFVQKTKFKALELDKALAKAKLTAEELAQVEFGKDLFKSHDKLEFDIEIYGLDETNKKVAAMMKEAGLDFKKFFQPDGSDSGNWLFGKDFKKQIDEFRAKAKQMEELDFGKKQMEEFQAIGKKAFEDTQLPIEKLITELNKLREAMGAGAGANDDFRKQQKKMKKEFLEGLGVEVDSPFEKFKKDSDQLKQFMMNNDDFTNKDFKKAQKDIQQKFGQSLGLDFETPFEDYTKKLSELQKAFDNNDITGEQLKMGTAQLNKKFNGGPMFAESADYGTQAARDTTLRQLFGTESSDPIDKVAAINRDQLTELREIQQALNNMKPQIPKIAQF